MRLTTSALVVLTLGTGLLSVGSSCTSHPEKPDTAAPAAPAGEKPATAPARPSLDAAAFAERLPGVSPEGLDGAQRAILVEVAEDVVCECGRPATLVGCLKEQPECAHGHRMASLARSLVGMGASALETSDALESYYASFSESRRATFTFEDSQCKGPADAPVTLVEFADFECPFCGFAWPLLNDLVGALGGKARLCFLHFPLSRHEHSPIAAQLTEYARSKGKFFETSQYLFSRQHALDRESLLGYAEELGLDRAEAADALGKGTYAAAVEAQRQQGVAAKVDGTPTVFINGRRFNLPFNAELLARAIEDELLWKAQGGKWVSD